MTDPAEGTLVALAVAVAVVVGLALVGVVAVVVAVVSGRTGDAGVVRDVGDAAIGDVLDA